LFIEGSNPVDGDAKVLEILQAEKMVAKLEDLIGRLKSLTTSDNMINSAIASLQKAEKIPFSRNKPLGWSVV
jgi:hypothetical protein